ncbi:hypothetical protein [Hymenobacter negativus]|uniref:Exo-alpha-sialidase n=1 Tax=Hymenobacter negativus TaxID=2795026 RepID=A0ABS3QGJ6_9BACT|nr:hypothetical protein [Hymenobacter negativus]MBO2010282.1 hypothetical protein [Hymenobacter negativus]
MKHAFLLFGVGLLAAACQKKDPELPLEAEDPDWIKLEIPTAFSGDEAYAITGDLDRTLMVSTKAQAFTSSDRGRTWQESRNFKQAVHGFLMRNDTLFALTSYRSTPQGERTEATDAELFTTDFGKTWAYTTPLPRGYERYHKLSQPYGRVTAAGITYRAQENTESIANSSSRLVVASDLLRTAGGPETSLRLPARHYLKNLYLDGQQRLYVAASGLRFDATTGLAINPTKGRPAVVYVSRRPLP